MSVFSNVNNVSSIFLVFRHLKQKFKSVGLIKTNGKIKKAISTIPIKFKFQLSKLFFFSVYL